jgi:hypothetical protein
MSRHALITPSCTANVKHAKAARMDKREEKRNGAYGTRNSDFSDHET